MIAKGISQDDFPENGVGRQSNRSFRMRTMIVREVLHYPLLFSPLDYEKTIMGF